MRTLVVALFALLFGLTCLTIGLFLPTPDTLQLTRRARHLPACRRFSAERAHRAMAGLALVFPQTADEADGDRWRQHERLRRVLADAVRAYLPLGQPLPGASLVFVPRLDPAGEPGEPPRGAVERYRPADGQVRVVAYICTVDGAGPRSAEAIVGDFRLVWKYLAGVGWPAWGDEGVPQWLVVPVSEGAGALHRQAGPSGGGEPAPTHRRSAPPADLFDEGGATGVLYPQPTDPLMVEADEPAQAPS